MSMLSPAIPVRPTLSKRATTVYAALTAISFSATSSAPTPLYHLYQQAMALSPLTVTVIFAAYAVAILVAFLTVASLSDYVGRRPMMFAALGLNAVALVLFASAGSAPVLILARVVQGIATGIAITTLGATILDTDRKNAALLNSVTSFIGLSLGLFAAGLLISFAPLPGQLIYLLLLAVTMVELVTLAFVPETTSGRPGALASLRPHASIPVAARRSMLRLLPLNVAAWALGGFYLSLMPTLVSTATGATSPLIGATVVAALVLTASIVVYGLRGLHPERLLLIAIGGLIAGIAVTLIGVAMQSATIMLAGTVIAGIGFGSAYSGTLRTLLPLAGDHERAGLLAAYFVVSYVAFSLPAVIAGIAAPVLGLVLTSEAYGGLLIVSLVIALLTNRALAPR